MQVTTRRPQREDLCKMASKEAETINFLVKELSYSAKRQINYQEALEAYIICRLLTSGIVKEHTVKHSLRTVAYGTSREFLQGEYNFDVSKNHWI